MNTAIPVISPLDTLELPKYEVADILRQYIDAYAQTHKLSAWQWSVVNALLNCRTAVLGAHVYECDGCGHIEISYNSCRNRHCPKCQGSKQAAWVDARLDELLPIPYHHVVFTLPDQELGNVFLLNKRVLYTLFFQAASETLKTFAQDPKWLGAEIGFMGVLHTWGQTLNYHVHLHFIVTGGGLSAEGAWVDPKYGGRFLFPVRALSKVFRGKFIEKLRQAYQAGTLQFQGEMADLAEPASFEGWLNDLARKRFRVYSQAPLRPGENGAGASPEDIVRYIGRYIYRVAIANYRIIDIEGGRIRFHYKDYEDGGKQKLMTLSATEFIRRFLRHILPKGFHKVWHYGLFGGNNRAEKLNRARRALAGQTQWVTTLPAHPGGTPGSSDGVLLLSEYQLWQIGEATPEKDGYEGKTCPECETGTLRLKRAYYVWESDQLLTWLLGPQRGRAFVWDDS